MNWHPLWQIHLRVDTAGQRECGLWLCAAELHFIWLVMRGTTVRVPSGWQRPERIFSLVIKPRSQDTEQAKRKILLQVLHRGPVVEFAGLARTIHLTVCEASLSRRLRGVLPASCPMVFLPCDKWWKRRKQKQWSSLGGKESVLSTKFTRAAMSRKLVPHTFSPDNLNLEGKKTLTTFISIRSCSQRSGRLTSSLTCPWLLWGEIPGYLCLRVGVDRQVRSSEYLAVHDSCWGEEKFAP